MAPTTHLSDLPAQAVHELIEPHSALSGRLPIWLRLIHWGIILNLLGQWLYGGWQVFVVLAPDGVIGPMFGAAASIPYELMMARRMYALEAWVAFLGLAIYLGVTEVLPRRTGR